MRLDYRQRLGENLCRMKDEGLLSLALEIPKALETFFFLLLLAA